MNERKEETYLFIYLFKHFHHNRETSCGRGCTTERGSKLSAPFYPPNHDIPQKTDHNTRNKRIKRVICKGLFGSENEWLGNWIKQDGKMLNSRPSQNRYKKYHNHCIFLKKELVRRVSKIIRDCKKIVNQWKLLWNICIL